MGLNRRNIIAAGLGLAFWPAKPQAQEAPPIHWPAEGLLLRRGERGQVTNIIDGDAFVMVGGLVVRMAGIEAPRLRQADPISVAARQRLSSMILGQEVQLHYGGLDRDSRGRSLAHVSVPEKDGLWVGGQLLFDGLARVHTYIDNRDLVVPMWGLERESRRANRGLWTNSAYQIRFATAEALSGDDHSFQLVEGKVLSVETHARVLIGQFAYGENAPIRFLVPQHGYHLWPNGAADIWALKDQNIRLRGYVRIDRNGPMIILDHPEQIEFLLPQ